MKVPKNPSEHERWFISRVRKDNSINKLNKRQQKILNKVRKWEKFDGPIDQKKWDF